MTVTILRELIARRGRGKEHWEETIEDSVLLGNDVASMDNPTQTFEAA